MNKKRKQVFVHLWLTFMLRQPLRDFNLAIPFFPHTKRGQVFFRTLRANLNSTTNISADVRGQRLEIFNKATDKLQSMR